MSNGDAVIDPTDIVVRARSEASRLASVLRWRPAFAGASPDAPRLVKRLDQIDQYYYIVTFSVSERVTARLRMNAHTGNYSEGIGVDKITGELPPYQTPEQTHERIARMVSAERKKKKRKGPSVPAISIEPRLVWKPCAQSLSAFLPFYLITVDRSVRYARVDGEIYDELTFGAGL